ncbi:helix-turn-helix domain-containing protein [Pontibacter sp. MBLB2868]|uniref:helix-turn-helix domain-containing protein n=1 Tax=Pontibacter sp. MBLB2868 TaxID=3451555 RepID=UPI003F74F943
MLTPKKPKNKAVIPSEVRFNNSLLPGEKVLYGEINALCGRLGHCWPRNRYFAQLYGKSTKTISRWLKKLEQFGLIKMTVNREMYDRREIHLLSPYKPSVGGGQDTGEAGVVHSCPENAATLLIGKKNDRINDENKYSSRPHQNQNLNFFLNGAAPTLEQVRECMESLPTAKTAGLKLEVEAEKFHLNYSANGWMMGSAKMQNLPAATEKWLQRARIFNQKNNFNHGTNFKANAKKQPNQHLHTQPYEGTAF